MTYLSGARTALGCKERASRLVRIAVDPGCKRSLSLGWPLFDLDRPVFSVRPPCACIQDPVYLICNSCVER